MQATTVKGGVKVETDCTPVVLISLVGPVICIPDLLLKLSCGTTNNAGGEEDAAG